MKLWLAQHWPLILLLCLASPTLLFNLDGYSLVNEDEDIYHQMALTMVESGNWFRLEARGEHRVYDTFMNAPLHYWVRASLIEIFGSSLWTMRLPSAAMGVATVWMTYILGAFLGNRWTGFLAGLVQLTTFQFVFLHGARTGELDTSLSFLLVVLAYQFLRAVERDGSFILHHVALLALATVKLPVLLIPLVAEAIALVCVRDWRPKIWRWGLTLACLAPIGMAWHIGQVVALGSSAAEVAFQMLGEASGSEFQGTALENLGFYLSAFNFGAFPYILVYPLAGYSIWKTLRTSDTTPVQWRRWGVVAVFPAVLLAFYLSVSKHYPWYIIPAYPFLSVSVGVWLYSLTQQRLNLRGALLLAGVATAIWGIDTGGAEFNPFVERAFLIDMNLGWRTLGTLPPFLALPLVAVLLIVSGFVFARQQPERFERMIPGAFIAILLGTAGLRVGEAMRHLDYQSPTAALRTRLDAGRNTTPPQPFPVQMPIPFDWDTRFYLEDTYRLERVTSDGSSHYAIFLLTPDTEN